MENIMSIAAGGAAGAVLRYFLGNILTRIWGSSFPYGTFLINIAGCFFMGLLMTVIVDKGMLSPSWRLFLCVGLLGGFTTFSSFSYETLVLLQQGKLLFAMIYTGGSVLLGVLAAFAGVMLADI